MPLTIAQRNWLSCLGAAAFFGRKAARVHTSQGQCKLQHVIITGGSSGIGAALARLHLARGSKVSLIARDAARLDEAAARLAEAGRAPAVFAADVSDRTALEGAIEEAEALSGPCDLLVTSAGIAHPGYFAALSQDDFRTQMDVNFFGTVNAVRAVLAGMRRRGRGRIVIISSGAALIGLYGYTAYGASKSALVGFAESLAAETAGSGVGIHIAFPPDTDTPQLAAERRLKPAEARALDGIGGEWSADRVARAIARGVDAGRFAIYLGPRIAFLGHFNGLTRPLLRRWLSARIARKGR